MEGTVVGVSLSATHSFSKAPRESIRLIAGLGVDGDAHFGRTVQHRYFVRTDPGRPNLRQVHLIHAELLDELSEDGFAIGPGALGENITTRGVDLLHLPLGTRLRIGDRVVLALTELRDPCGQIDDFKPGLRQASLSLDADGSVTGKAGVMSVVVAGGTVRAGDRVIIELPPGPHKALRIG